jgi:hypothetical protein
LQSRERCCFCERRKWMIFGILAKFQAGRISSVFTLALVRPGGLSALGRLSVQPQPSKLKKRCGRNQRILPAALAAVTRGLATRRKLGPGGNRWSRRSRPRGTTARARCGKRCGSRRRGRTRSRPGTPGSRPPSRRTIATRCHACRTTPTCSVGKRRPASGPNARQPSGA